MNFPGGYPSVRRTDINFPGGSICSSNRHEFSRRAIQKDIFFQGGSICSSNRPCYLHWCYLMTSNRYSFSRKLYLVLEHLRFSRRPYLVLKNIQFSRRLLCLEHIGIFQEGIYPSRTDISLIGLGGCFRKQFCFAHDTPSNERVCGVPVVWVLDDGPGMMGRSRGEKQSC